jgi:hypothetical protein
VKHFRRIGVLIAGILLLAGCHIAPDNSTPETPVSAPVAALSPTSAYPWTDENAVMGGICFEAAQDAAGKIFVFHAAQEHARFYDLADSSHLCREPVTRYPFEFAGDRVLAGLWSAATGCSARYEVLEAERNDSAKSIRIHLRLVVEGECGYELVEPFWVGLDNAADYQINITVG